MRLAWIFAASVAIAGGTTACAGNDFTPNPTATGTGTGTGSAVGGSGGEGPTECEPGEVVDCYTGPDETLDVGACAAGTQTCKDDGSGFGACNGEVTPVVETCATEIDDNCDGSTDDAPGGCACTPGTIDECYTGPDGTSGVGLCAAGQAMCMEDGSGYGVCQGEVLPIVESCTDPDDEDCNGSACSELDWGLVAGDGSSQTGTAIAFDSAGNAIVAGRFLGSMDLGGNVLISDGTFDIFVAKFDPDGNHLWSKAFGAADDQFVSSVGVSPTDDVLLTGYFDGAFSLGGTVMNSVGVSDGYVGKLSGVDGSHIWSSRFGDAGQTLPRALDVDIAGNTVIVGDHGLPAGCVATCSFNAFARKVSPFGGLLYDTENFDAGDQRARDVAFDPAGSAWMIGTFASTVNFGSLQTSAGGLDIFLTKLDATGAHSQTLRFGDANDQDGLSIAVDATGGPFIAGAFAGTTNFGGSNLISAGGNDFFLAHLSSGGVHVWSQRFGDASAQFQVYIAHAGDQLAVSGLLVGSANFGGGALTSAGSDDVFVAMFDAQGGFPQWSKRFGDNQAQRVRGLGLAGNGTVGVTGGFAGSIDFGSGVEFSVGSEDAFVATFQP